MITKWIRFTVEAESTNAFLAEIALLESESKAEQGCAHYSAYQCLEKPATFFVLESWDSPEAFEAHRSAPHIVRFKSNCESMILEKSAVSLSPVG